MSNPKLRFPHFNLQSVPPKLFMEGLKNAKTKEHMIFWRSFLFFPVSVSLEASLGNHLMETGIYRVKALG